MRPASRSEADEADRPPPFKILSRRRSCQAAGPSALHCLPATAPPGSFFSNIYWWPGARGIVDSAPDFPSNHVVPVWFNVVPTMPKRWHVLVSRRPNDEKQCGSHVVPRGSNNDDMDSGPDFPSNHAVPVWFSVVPTMPTCAFCSQQKKPSRLAVDPCWM